MMNGSCRPPNIEVRNTVNDHQHLFYLIDPAVYTLQQAWRKPLALAADVDRGLTELLGADPGYGKLIAKNPLYEQWLTIIWHDRAWGFNRIAWVYSPANTKKENKTHMNINSDFNVPMLEKEVKCIVRSISKWTSRYLTAAGFGKWCSIRGKAGNLKSQAVRKTKAEERAAKAKALYAGGKTQQQIAAILGINQSQVSRLFKVID